MRIQTMEELSPDYNYLLKIAYDGTRYSGWQVQKNASSIQQLIEEALDIIIKEKVRLIGSGRTDAGVHALEQIANFKSTHELPISRIHNSLNAILPKDIRILEMQSAPQAFHAQHSAIGKIYHYHITLDRYQSPFQRLYAYHAHEILDIPLLAEGANYFIGTHDFSAFANSAKEGCAAYDPVRTLKRLDLVREPGGIRLEFEADGFLYKMVRNIVGTLFEIAQSKRLPCDIPNIFHSRDRRLAGKAAPAHGLFLVKVHY